MATFTSSSFSLLDDNPVVSASGGGSSSGATFEDAFEDACSICLEPFTTQNPSTVTSCNHEYHLQCILEWSQRSKECPVCWRLLLLKDPACQELLAAVETERHLRSRTTSSSASINSTPFHEDFDVEQDPNSDDSDIDEHIMQHLAAVASRSHYIRRRERHRSAGQGPSQVLIFPTLPNVSSAQQMRTSNGEDPYVCEQSPTPLVESQPPLPLVPPVMNVVSNGTGNREVPSKPSSLSRVLFRQQQTDAPQMPSEILSFAEIKSKWVAASARYKESISKSTRGIKEKLLARNNSVKELGKEVQREMSAGIAGVARMIERLDLTSKRTGASSPVSAGTSEHSFKGKSMEEDVTARSVERKSEEIACTASLDALNVTPIPGQLEVHHVQRGN